MTMPFSHPLLPSPQVLRLDRPPKPQSRLRRKPLLSSQGSRGSMGSKAGVASPTYSAPPPPQRRPSTISSPSVNSDSPSSRPPPPAPVPQPRPSQPPPARVPSSDNTSSFLDTSGTRHLYTYMVSFAV